MKPKARWAALVLGLAACLAVSYGAYTLATYSWNQVVDYRGPYARAKLPAGEAPVSDARYLAASASQRPRLVYVIVDGLREDVSRAMPALNDLRATGFDAVVRTAQPALSFPNWTTLLSGAPQRISGVTTNWYEQRVAVETVFDTALAASRTVAVSAPTDFEMLYGVKRSPYVFLRDWEAGAYMSAGIVDNAIRLAGESGATLVIVHLPDIDEAGHEAGGASRLYRDTAAKVDADLARLVGALRDDRTTFVVASDHGHIDTGGHGGAEVVVTDVPAVFAGPGLGRGVGRGTQDQVAPTVAMLAALAPPRNATGAPLSVRGASPAAPGFSRQRMAALDAYTAAVGGGPATPSSDASAAAAAFESATEARLGRERAARLPVAAALAVGAVLALVAVGLLSWRALVAAFAGTAAYYLVYDGLYFGAHRFGIWSLSSFNSESMLKAFMNARMLEAVVGGVVAVLVAADVYLFTRARPRRPAGEYLPGWLSLGVATVMVIQATLALQVAWYLWWWGASVSWYIPDLTYGFKYDLDLIQLTALAGSAVIAPLLTFLVGRYHPIRSPKQGETAEPA